MILSIGPSVDPRIIYLGCIPLTLACVWQLSTLAVAIDSKILWDWIPPLSGALALVPLVPMELEVALIRPSGFTIALFRLLNLFVMFTLAAAGWHYAAELHGPRDEPSGLETIADRAPERVRDTLEGQQ